MAKVKWLVVSEGIANILVGLCFLLVKFYNIVEVITVDGYDYNITQTNWTAFQQNFHEIFTEVPYNVFFFLLFLFVGIVKIVQGVKKNGCQ